LNLGFDPQKERAAVAKATAEAADPKAPKKSKVPSSNEGCGLPENEDDEEGGEEASARKSAKKSSTKKGGR
jgi:hypothetical protein